ncbi:hypothetical protein AK830_g2121 [Neonectria ditissima]|uniref:MULE transposase domain-containing protein n=1 Tax=Neonectria ditissima TaxID=78410 RepID=A0A0P7BSR0_9HYPO|nr:hypothetical protein AK830_g2121 [Neonectria ditissima]
MPLEPPDFLEGFVSQEVAFEVIQEWARGQGYAVVRSKPSNYSNGIPRRMDVVCACGGLPYNKNSLGIRKSSSRKTNCPFKLKLVQRRNLGDMWYMTLMCGTHNHDPSRPSAFPEHRRLTQRHIREIEAQTRDTGASARAIREALEADEPDLFVTERDVWNVQQRLQQKEKAGPEPTKELVDLLDKENYSHQHKLDEDGNLQYLFVLIDKQMRLWEHYFHLITFDVSNNSNRFGLKLLEINGVTSLGTVFPCAYALSTDESEDFFFWVLNHLKTLLSDFATLKRLEHSAFFPHVIIHHYDSPEPIRVVNTVFPETQLQLCLWHIGKTVTKATRERWFGPDSAPEDIMSIPNMINEEQTTDDTRPIGLTRNDFLKSWRLVMQAPTLHDFEERWLDLQADWTSQADLVSYLRGTYIQIAPQWARAYTRFYRNYGQQTTTPSDIQHFNNRTFRKHHRLTLVELFTAVKVHCKACYDTYEAQCVVESTRSEAVFREALFPLVVRRVSWKSLHLVHKEYHIARASLMDLQNRSLTPCTNSFSARYGLPCSHVILRHLSCQGEGEQRQVMVANPLELASWDNNWLLRRDLPENNPYRRARHGQIIPQKRRPQNTAIPVPRPVLSHGLAPGSATLPVSLPPLAAASVPPPVSISVPVPVAVPVAAPSAPTALQRRQQQRKRRRHQETLTQAPSSTAQTFEISAAQSEAIINSMTERVISLIDQRISERLRNLPSLPPSQTVSHQVTPPTADTASSQSDNLQQRRPLPQTASNSQSIQGPGVLQRRGHGTPGGFNGYEPTGVPQNVPLREYRERPLSFQPSSSRLPMGNALPRVNDASEFLLPLTQAQQSSGDIEEQQQPRWGQLHRSANAQVYDQQMHFS